MEDLLDIKIFSSMSVLLKEKIRSLKEDARTFELKRQSLKDKVEMQKEISSNSWNQRVRKISVIKNKRLPLSSMKRTPT